MKILYVTTISTTMDFFPEHIKMLQENGHVVELACNCTISFNDRIKKLNCKTHHIPFSRSIYSLNNIKGYVEIHKLIKKGAYDVVHTHTPNASAIVRVACRESRKKGLKVIYTAHGFHFYKGAPLKNWLLFFPVEWVCAHWTDVLITINREDYELAKRCIKAKKVEYVPGVGIEIKKFQESECQRKNEGEIRKTFGVTAKDVVLLSVGELNRNKSHRTVIEAIGQLKNSRVHYVIAGTGEQFNYLQSLAEKLGVKDQIHLLGFREDVASLYQCSDIYVLPSIREGLNVSLMEAMASGLPCVASKIRGNVDLILDGKGGILCKKTGTEEYAAAIKKLLESKEICKKMGEFNKERVHGFSNHYVLKRMKKIINGVS